MPLEDALMSLASGFGAEAAAISRHLGSEEGCRLVASYDARKGDPVGAHLRKAYTPEVLGGYYNRMRGGSVWYLSDHHDDIGASDTGGLASWLVGRGIAEIVVIALESTGLQHDYLELHFADVVAVAERDDAERMFPTLVRAWSGRRAGLITQTQMDERIARARAVARSERIRPDEAILGMSNPAKLSRAEFRVCILLSRGLSIRGVTEELGLCEATIRSHLRSIYAKTQTSGLAELVYRLLSGGTDDPGVGIRAR